MKRFLLITLLTIITISCSDSALPELVTYDPDSYSNPSEVAITHMNLDLNIDFEKQQIIGVAELTLNNKTKTDSLVLDTYDLSIQKVTIGEPEVKTQYKVGNKDSVLGSPLVIKIDDQTKIVKIYYTTSPNAPALQWLDATQTTDKSNPFLYTQSESIFARCWVPCQDTPNNRFTYSAKVKVPKDLLALMSAENPKEKNADGIYTFEMRKSIPSYLLALAVGDLKFSELGPRTGVYAELSVLPKAALEFIDTEKMLRSAEKLCGPYLWGRYDILVLPPSFPYGGMENPRLTFITPTIIAGDKSLTNVIAHEIAHSWSGNQVTNATWNDSWLNEGFASYIEKRIIEELYGFEYKEMLAVLDYNNLVSRMDRQAKETKSASGIGADKGALFLRTIEEAVGREKFDKFLSDYFQQFKFQSMTSAKFEKYLNEKLIKGDSELDNKISINEWLYKPGMPSNTVVPQTEQFDIVHGEVIAWLNELPAKELNTKLWNTYYYLEFIKELPSNMSQLQLKELDEVFGFTSSHNSEILCEWLQKAIHSNYKPAVDRLSNFLMSVGRIKLIKPLYSKLAETEKGKKLALEIYTKARPFYHPIAQRRIDKLLDWQN